MPNWRVAGLAEGVPPAQWQVFDLSGSAEVASASTAKWQVAKISGTVFTPTAQWRVAGLSGGTTKLVPNWRVAFVQARTIKSTSGYMWAYINGDWRPAFMHVFLDGGWVSIEPEV